MMDHKIDTSKANSIINVKNNNYKIIFNDNGEIRRREKIISNVNNHLESNLLEKYNIHEGFKVYYDTWQEEDIEETYFEDEWYVEEIPIIINDTGNDSGSTTDSSDEPILPTVWSNSSPFRRSSRLARKQNKNKNNDQNNRSNSHSNESNSISLSPMYMTRAKAKIVENLFNNNNNNNNNNASIKTTSDDTSMGGIASNDSEEYDSDYVPNNFAVARMNGNNSNSNSNDSDFNLMRLCNNNNKRRRSKRKKKHKKQSKKKRRKTTTKRIRKVRRKRRVEKMRRIRTNVYCVNKSFDNL